MTTLQLPDTMRIIDLVRFAQASNCRVRWIRSGLSLKPVMEPIHDAPADSVMPHRGHMAHGQPASPRPLGMAG